MNISQMSVAEIAEAMRLGAITAKSCLAHFQNQTHRCNPALNAFVQIDDGSSGFGSSSQFEPPDAARPLAGIPVAIKDVICTRHLRATAGSAMLRDFVSPFDATVARKLVDAGAVIVGTTNTDEFAMGSSTENSCYGPTRNPWDTSRVPGGSSGGSAAAVAAGMVPLALGSDTGGSVRQPAAFCGITGLKPTYGRVSRFGLIAFASSLDQIGPMGRSAADVAMLLQVIAGHDPCDSTSVRQDVPDYVSVLDRDIRGLKVGVRRSQLDEIVEPGISDAIQTALSVLESLGASLVPIDMPHEQYGVAAYYVIAPCEASSNLARYDGVRYTRRVSGDDLSALYTRSRSQYFGPEVKRRIMVGSYALSSGYYNQYYLRASRVRRLIKEDYDRAFARVDVIAGPTTPTTAFAIGQRSHDPLQMYAADVFTVSANLAGIPAISIPAGCANSLPVGMQLQGPAFREPMLLNVAHQFQSVTDWHQRRPYE